jgi:DNA-directed RNA polymerase subunit RPC12/RpoP
MPVTVRCDQCQKPITVPLQSVGRKVACPHCRKLTLVPPNADSAGCASSPAPPTAALPPAPRPASWQSSADEPRQLAGRSPIRAIIAVAVIIVGILALFSKGCQPSGTPGAPRSPG